MLTLAALLLLAGCSLNERSYGPNVVLIVVDTVRADHLGTYGYERKTDAKLQKFAEEAAVFTQAYSHAPWTKPSIASMLTSRLPREHGVGTWHSLLRPEIRTLPEVLKEAGYRTEAYVSHHALNPQTTNLDRGFDVYDISAYEGTDPHKAVNAHKVTDLGIASLENQSMESPFFLWLHYFDPHNYYQNHEEFPFGKRKMDRYDAEIAYTDKQIGRFLKYVEHSGRDEDTIVIITADHGEAFKEHGITLHTTDLHNELIRVPLLIRVPGLRPTRDDHSVGLLSLTPTILSLLGLPKQPDFAGRAIDVSFWRKLSLDKDRRVFSSTTYEADKRSAVRGDRKVIRDLENDTWLYYDLGADPLEQNPLPTDETVSGLKKQLIDEIGNTPQKAEELPMDDEQRKILEELGYVDPDQ